MKVAIIDYGSGNLHSALKAFERAAGASGQITVTADPDVVRKAERIVLPGVGAFKDCYEGLMAVPGMRDTLQEQVIARGKPFLGICVGMQLMATRGLEHDITPGLGWIAGEVDRIAPSDPGLKIPHMGWNTLSARHPHPRRAGGSIAGRARIGAGTRSGARRAADHGCARTPVRERGPGLR